MSASALSAEGALRAQIDLVAANVRRCSDALDADLLGVRLPDDVRNPLQGKLAQDESELRSLRDRVASAGHADALWQEFAGLGDEVDGRIAEALGLLEGALARGAGVDDGLCNIADALASDLGDTTPVSWVGLTILAAQESFAQRARTISVRFPDLTVWALPLTAHEFGHLVAQELSDLRADGTHDFLADVEIRNSGIPIAHARELFADAFATFTVGPAYACTAILLRFRPTRAQSGDGATHPNDAKRAHAMLRALRWLSVEQHPVDRPYDAVVDTLDRAWTDMLRACGQASELDDEVAGHLTYLVEHVYLPLLRTTMPRARYTGWADAHAIARHLGVGGLDGAPPVASIPDVVNAAWLARIARGDQPGAVDAIASDALTLLRAAVGARPSIPIQRGNVS
jgi:hypothetical protein